MEEPEASTKLYIGNLFYELTQEDVEEEFGKFGPIEQCSVKKGYAFVHYEQLKDAETAVKAMNDKELGGRRLRVAFAVSSGFPQRRLDGPPQHHAPQKHHSPRFGGGVSPNLFVANIPPHIKMSQLDQAFAQFGEVKNVKVLPQARADAPMSAFVDYADVDAAQKAHDASIMIDGQQLRTDYNFRKNKNGDAPRRPNRGSFDGPPGSYDGEREARPRYDSFDQGRKSYPPRFEEEPDDRYRRHHSSRHHSRHGSPERGRSGSPSRSHYHRHSSSNSRRGEESPGLRDRSRDYGTERSYARRELEPPILQAGRQPQSGYYEHRQRVPREYNGRGMDKAPQEYRRYSRPESSAQRRGPRNDRSWSPMPRPSRSRSRSR